MGQLRHRPQGDGRARPPSLADWRGLISCLPNAGLPELRCGHTHYPLGADELAAGSSVHRRGRDQHRRRLLRHHGRAHRGARRHAAPDRRGRLSAGAAATPPQHALAGLPVLGRAAAPGGAFLAIGERCNANGSKKFRELQAAGDWDGCVAMGRSRCARQQRARRLHAFVGRDEVAEMTEVVSRMRGQVDSPLVIDRPSCRCWRRRWSSMAARPS